MKSNNSMDIRKYISCIFFQYNTAKYISVNCKILGLINRFLYLCIVVYMFGYVLIYKEGYKEFDVVESAVTTKVKGVTLTNFSKADFQIPEPHIQLYNRLWDVAEYVLPSYADESFFIMTNAIITPNQTFGVCDEDPNVKGAVCGDGLPPCLPGHQYLLGNGVATGKCINSTKKIGTTVCEVKAWCPIELNVLPLKNSKPLLEESKYFTVLIKNRIYFPKYGHIYKRSNILMSTSISYLKTCHYHEEKHPFCPVFQIKDIVENAGQNFTEVALKGAVIAIQIYWDCNLDKDFMQNCRPKYSFHRLDDTNYNLTLGWNFRHSFHHEFGRRTLIKVYGIHFVLDVQGQGGIFSWRHTFFHIGAGLGCIGMVTFVSDVIMLTCVKSKKAYRKHKYAALKGDKPYNVNNGQYQLVTTL